MGPTEFRWNTRTPDGPGSLVLERVDASTVEVEAFGPGAEWMVAQAPRVLGRDDDLTGFVPPKGPLGDLWRRQPFLLGRTDRPWDALVGAILGQKVQARNARRSRRMLARRFGDPAPGPDGGWILPSPERTSELGYSDFHPLGVERKRAEILLRVAREMSRLQTLGAQPPAEVRSRLERIRGVGVWTSALVTATALGDPDAVPVGDFHLPNLSLIHI